MGDGEKWVLVGGSKGKSIEWKEFEKNRSATLF